MLPFLIMKRNKKNFMYVYSSLKLWVERVGREPGGLAGCRRRGYLATFGDVLTEYLPS
jgi:hypothetical protein